MKLIKDPTVIAAAGNLPKRIAEYVGRVNSGTAALSIAHMTSPPGWKEPGQTSGFDEYTVVLRGSETRSAITDVLRDRPSSRLKANGCGTARPARKGPTTSPSACRPFRQKRCIATPDEGSTRCAGLNGRNDDKVVSRAATLGPGTATALERVAFAIKARVRETP